MLEDKKRDSLEKRLKDELEWYTLYASDEEYDEKAVESILYLLDRWEPLKKETVPPVEESWKRFLAIADKKELLPVEDADIVLEASKRKAGHTKQEPAPENDEAQAQKILELRKTGQRVKTGERQAPAEEGKSDEGLAALQEWEMDEDGAMLQMAEMNRGTVAMENGRATAGHGIAVAENGTAVAENCMAVVENGTVAVENSMATAENGTVVAENGMAASENDMAVAENGMAVAGHGMAAGKVGREEEPGDIAGNMPGGQMAKEENSDLPGTGKTVRHGKARKLVKFASRHKIIVAAVLVLMVLMVRNTVHVVANPEEGFFFWMKRDDSGVKMLTSPEGLDSTTNNDVSIYYKQEDVPEWAQGWISVEEEIEMPENYEWKYFEVNELNNRKCVEGHYWNDDIKSEIVLGVWVYADKISYGKEGFIGYTYIQSHELDKVQMDIYSRKEMNSVFYIVCIYEGNSQYYIRGQDNLEELQILMEKYWRCANNI